MYTNIYMYIYIYIYIYIYNLQTVDFDDVTFDLPGDFYKPLYQAPLHQQIFQSP